MTHHTTRIHGRPFSAVPQTPTFSHDKWTLIDELTLAAPSYGISHRTVAVLRTMLTFVPQRELPALPGRAIVFASNATLSARLGGMPESTLRRHLAALVTAGIIVRIDSPNRKRFAKRFGEGIACAYGFDLAPLAIMARDISARAHTAQLKAQEHSLLRTTLLALRQRLIVTLQALGIDIEGPHALSPLLGHARLQLRRKENHSELRRLITCFENALKTDLETSSSSASDTQNERHLHKKTNIKSEEPLFQETALEEESGLEITQRFTQYLGMYPNVATSWIELDRHAQDLVPMMGIDRNLYDDARRYMGPTIAPIAILCLLERFDSLSNPGGFLRHLIKQSCSTGLDLQRLLRFADTIVS